MVIFGFIIYIYIYNIYDIRDFKYYLFERSINGYLK